MSQDTRNSLLSCIALVMLVFSIGFHRINPTRSETMLSSIEEEHDIQVTRDKIEQRNDKATTASMQAQQKKIKHLLSVVFLMPFASGKSGL